MSFTFDPYKLRSADVSSAEDVLMTNPTALTELETYWRSMPHTRGVPSRKDVDPLIVGNLLEDCFVLERVAPGVARIRVAGRSIQKLLGLEPRGLPLSAAFLGESRPSLARHIEAAFTTPALVELELTSPRAMGQPALQGKILLLPLRDNHGRVSRLLGALVMSGRRGSGGRRFEINDNAAVRFEMCRGLHAVGAPKPEPQRPSLQAVPTGTKADSKKAEAKPALRLVVSNP